jgi:hypothetical protein
MLLSSNIFLSSFTPQNEECQSKFGSYAETFGFVPFNNRPIFQELLFILPYFHPVFGRLSWKIMHPGLGQIAFALNPGHRALSGFGHFWGGFTLGSRTGIGGLIHALTLFQQKSRMIREIILKGKRQERDLAGHICGTFYRLRVELYVLLAIYNLL